MSHLIDIMFSVVLWKEYILIDSFDNSIIIPKINVECIVIDKYKEKND